MLKCVCGSELFEDIAPIKLEAGGFRIWSTKEKLHPIAKGIPIIVCLKCNRASVPATSLQGKNSLDNEVKMYKELIELVEDRNARIEALERLFFRTKVLENAVDSLTKSPLAPVPVEEVPEEPADVETAKPNRGNSKKAA